MPFRVASQEPLGPSKSPSEADRTIGWKGRTALALFAVHTLLLFFPPIPPDVKGSLWSYILGYLAVVFGALESAPRSGDLARRWRALTPPRRVVIGVGTALAVLIAGLSLRLASSDVFVRWAREEGVFEPLTVLCYVVGALLLFSAASGKAVAERRHLRFLGAGFVLLVLEEVDYLGIAGGLIGRINGVYVGAPHDLINLAVEGLLSPTLAAILVAVILCIGTVLLWAGYLQPVRLARTVLSPSGLWLVGAAGFLALAAAEDAGVFLVFGLPRTEELLELVAAILLVGFALDVASGITERGEASDQSGVGRASTGGAGAPHRRDRGPTSPLR